jgi:hypothetical protein
MRRGGLIGLGLYIVAVCGIGTYFGGLKGLWVFVLGLAIIGLAIGLVLGAIWLGRKAERMMGFTLNGDRLYTAGLLIGLGLYIYWAFKPEDWSWGPLFEAIGTVLAVWVIWFFLRKWWNREMQEWPQSEETRPEIGMAARLGNVLYWAGTLIACLIVGLIAYAVLFGTGKGDPFLQGLGLFVAAVIWLIGRAARAVTLYRRGRAWRLPRRGHRAEDRWRTGQPQQPRDDMTEFSYRHNDETGRWDVIKRLPDGTEEVLHKVSFRTPGEASNHVAQLTGKPPGPPGKWFSQGE